MSTLTKATRIGKIGFILWLCCVLLVSAELMTMKTAAVSYRTQDQARQPIAEFDLQQLGLNAKSEPKDAKPSGVGIANKPVAVAGTEELSADDGTPEVAIGADNLIAVNRLTPSAYPATLQSIRIFFVSLPGLPTVEGAQIKLIAFAGAAGVAAPPANPTFLINQTVTIPAVPATGGFVDFPIQNGPVISGGNIFVGFQAPNPRGGVTFIADQSGTQQQRGYISSNNGQPFTGPVTLSSGAPINLMIRAVVMNDAQPVPRINVPQVLSFGNSEIGMQQQQNLTISNTGGVSLNVTNITSNNAQFTIPTLTFPIVIAAGGQTQIAVRFTPSSLGAQNATLTIASNDASQPSATVALSGVGGAPLSATVFINSGVSVSNSIPAPPLGGAVLLTTQFAIFVPAGATQLKIDLTGNQDVDLFARFNQRIGVSGGNLQADFGSTNDGILPETITITLTSSPALQPGLHYIALANFGPGAANYTLTATVTGGTAPGAVATTSAASFIGTEVAADEIVALFGGNLATGTQVSTTLPLPTALLGTSVKVRDNAGVERLASLFFVAPGQINAAIPTGTSVGAAQIVVTAGDGKVSIGIIQITNVLPGIFTANASGVGIAAATALRIKADGSQSFEPVSRFDTGTNTTVAVPIDLGPATDQVFLILNGTGIRGRSSLAAVTATIGGVATSVTYAGDQGSFVGLDQVNILIPRGLIGRGEVNVVLIVDGKTANTVKVNVK